ncbi:PREDICTED: 1-aminocyclopropane-1-carboxylate oxidase 1-like [Erythranthe guttata]|uniref:1-aminocyclopropane-1-carboxylate oxidase 1-like n=1 Tax=Erythranthe guttata TaxID=4155 RepID=UPI00064E0D32|nr:PREDICTED: 1-aminocyclopropane-1-carboxylate oxidase 1-like [Erythranthe guttata]|eukprot:XP_012845411.1 PREDICTED: 1-aminocyclopropane-1-carboxylate oxidase 1-like [Erythranthe guttata]
MGILYGDEKMSYVKTAFYIYMQIENHKIDIELTEKVKLLVNRHYEDNLKATFYKSETAQILENNGYIGDKDWESTFFIWRRLYSNINELTSLSKDLR